jgi:sigma-B regulation protein RsbU (phosphoserine phosphatase)
MGRIDAPTASFWSALVLVGLVATADVLDDSTSLVGAVAVAPLLAATLCSAVRTAVVSLVGIVVGVWLLATQGEPELLSIAVRAGVLVLACVLAPVLATARTGRERRIRDLTKVAEAAQLAVLTPIPPVAGPTRLASAYQSASREALIGGDLYGVSETPRGVRLMIGDVRGKGIDAVRIAAVILAAFRDGTQRKSRLAKLADHCDAQLRPHLVSEDFVTALFADIDHSGRVEFISCGHPGPIHARGDRLFDVEFANPGTPLGFPLEFRATPRPHRFALQPGDRLLFYTDGLLEARTSRGGFVAAEGIIGDIGTAHFEEALGGVLARLHAVTYEVRDDLALLLVEYTGSTPDPEPDIAEISQRGASTGPPGR